MKLLFVSLVCLICQSASAQQSYLYVYRGGQFGASLTNFSIYVDGKKICKLSNGKYFKIPLEPGTHEIEAKKSGMDLNKKETFISITTEAGKDNYISCNVKRSITRSRLEMDEVVPNNGKKDIAKMKEDNCSESDD